jgi:hypothetical protein
MQMIQSPVFVPAATVLDPLFTKFAPIVKDVAEFINNKGAMIVVIVAFCAEIVQLGFADHVPAGIVTAQRPEDIFPTEIQFDELEITELLDEHATKARSTLSTPLELEVTPPATSGAFPPW